MRKGRLVAAGLAAVLVCVLLTVAIFLTPGSEQPDRPAGDAGFAIGGWRLTAGNASALAPIDETTRAVRAPVTLETDGVKVRFTPGSRVEFLVDEALVTTAVPIVVNGQTITPDGNAQLALTPLGLRVIVGPILLDDGRWLGDGLIPYHELRIDPTSTSTVGGEPATDSGSGGRRPQHATGVIVDAQTNAAIRGAHIVATFSYSDDGYPPYSDGGNPDDSDLDDGSQVELTADSSGRFTVPSFRPEDPRLYLHLTIDHPRYQPEIFVLEEPRELDGSRFQVTVFLRQARTYTALFSDRDGLALVHAAVEISPRQTLDGFVGEDQWDEGRTLRKDKRQIAYTRSDGRLRFGPNRTTFELLDPLRYLFDVTIQDIVGSVELPPFEPESRWIQPFEVVARTGEPRDYVVEDADSQRVTDAVIEVALEGMPAMRLSTDTDGGFTFAPWPYPKTLLVPVPLDNPRFGTLTCLSPRFWKRRVRIAMPSRRPLITMEGRVSGRLSFRAVTPGAVTPGPITPGEGGPVAIEPHDVRLSNNDMTRVWWSPDGQVVFEGPLPPPKTELTIFVRGHLPSIIEMPTFHPGTKEADLGEIVFDQGRAVSVQIVGDTEQVTGAVPLRFLVADYEAAAEEDPTEAPFHAQRHPIDGGSVSVGGLVRGRRYRYSLESGRWDDVAGEFLATEEMLQTGLAVTLVRPPEELTLLGGFLDGVDPEQSHRFRVVERYSSERRGPIACVSYPLSPSGSFGSVRRLFHHLDGPATAAEVFIIDGFGIQGARSIRFDRQDKGVFDMGSPMLAPVPYAVFTFEGAPGHVRTPENVSLAAAKGRYHELAMISDFDRGLLIRNLFEGEYRLQWTNQGGRRESYRFEVGRDDLEIRATIERRTGASEGVFVRVENEAGRPVSGLAISMRDRSDKWRELEPVETVGEDLEKFQANIPLVLERQLVGPGYYVVPVTLDEAIAFRVSDPNLGYLPITVTVPPSRRVPDRLVLRTGAKVVATVFDVDREPFSGPLRIDWQQVRGEEEIVDNDVEELPIEITHGEPFTTVVDEVGALDDRRFPSGRHEFVFRAENSEAKTSSVLDLTPEKDDGRSNDAGELRLEQGRFLRGVVRLPTGEVAARAIVALVDPEHAYRLLGRATNLREQAYSTRADSLGNFVIDGLPLDLSDEYALVASLKGWTDAVEDPVDITVEEHFLELGENTELVVNVGYRDGGVHETYEFRLEYSPTGDPEDELTDLGNVEPTGRGGLRHSGVSPGYYQLTWNLREPHPTVGARSVATFLEPDGEARLTLRISDTFCRGEAIFNGLPLERGWVLVTPDPSDGAETRVGRVHDGAFETVAPTRSPSAYVALIPELSPIPEPNFARGEVLPVAYERYRFDVKRGFLSVDYRAYNLTYELPASVFREYSKIEVEFPSYEWARTGFRRGLRTERVTDRLFRLMLVPHGRLALRFTSPDGYRHINDVEMIRDVEIRIRR